MKKLLSVDHMIQIIDDLIPRPFADKIEVALTDDDTPWNLAVTCGGYNEMANVNHSMVKDTHQLYHAIVSDNMPKSMISSLVTCILYFLEDKTGITTKFAARVKANLLLPMFDNADQYHPPHIDIANAEYLSMVYYVNDSDGPTRFFDNDGNIIQTVEPKKGRAVLFSSNIPHASSCPITSKHRIVINFVFMPA